MKALTISTAINLADHQLALEWAKKHYPPQEADKIIHSYKTIFKTCVLFIVLVCLPIMITFMYVAMSAPFSSRAELKEWPRGATETKIARVDADDNFYWTANSKRYEQALIDYGLDPKQFEFGDEVKIYLDDAQHILKVSDVEAGWSLREIEVVVGSVGAILVPVLLILLVYMPIAYHTFAKPWRQFYCEYQKR